MATTTSTNTTSSTTTTTIRSNQYLIQGLETHLSTERNSKTYHALKLVIQSIKAYPMPLTYEKIDDLKGIGVVTKDILGKLIQKGPPKEIKEEEELKKRLKERLDSQGFDLDDILSFKRPCNFKDWVKNIAGLKHPEDVIAQFNRMSVNSLEHIPLLDSRILDKFDIGIYLLLEKAIKQYKVYIWALKDYQQRDEKLDIIIRQIKSSSPSSLQPNYNDVDDDDDGISSTQQSDDIRIDGPPTPMSLQYIKSLCSENVFNNSYLMIETRKLSNIHVGEDNIIQVNVSPSENNSVRGRGDNAYQVLITLSPNRKVIARCSCTCEHSNGRTYRFPVSNLCKHIISPLIVLSLHYDTNNNNNDDNDNDISVLDSNNMNNNNIISTTPASVTRSRPTTTSTTSTTGSSKQYSYQNIDDYEYQGVGKDDDSFDYGDIDDGDDNSPTRDKSKGTTKQIKKRRLSNNNNNNSTDIDNDKDKEYQPKFRSGGWGILMALYIKAMDHENPKDGLTKNELIILAHEHSDAEFNTKNDNSGWRSMKTLKEHQFVSEDGLPKIFKLTSKGFSLASQLYKSRRVKVIKMVDTNSQNDDHGEGTNNVDYHDNAISLRGGSHTENEYGEYEPLTTDEQIVYNWSDDSDSETIDWLVERPFPMDKSDIFKIKKQSINIREVVLLVDNREIKNHRKNGDSILQLLQAIGVRHEQRALPLGDFLWIARVNYLLDEEQTVYEMVMDTIIERKKIQDLLESIKDGRYKDQKYRLARCGINNPQYLIEGLLNRDRLRGGGGGSQEPQTNTTTTKDPDDDKVDQCISETFLEDEILPIRTKNEDETVHMLQMIHKRMVDHPHLYFSRMCYDEFVDLASHTPMTITNMFACMLLTIRGMTEKKVLSVIEDYPTLQSLIQHYKRLHSLSQKESLLADQVGLELSKEIYILYNSPDY